MRRIGVLMPLAADDPESLRRIAAFVQGLQQLGWTDSRRGGHDHRGGAGDADGTRRYAAELVGLAPDVVVAGCPVRGGVATAASTVPIVFVRRRSGRRRLYRKPRAPGGQCDRVHFRIRCERESAGAAEEIAPRLTRAAVLRDPGSPAGIGQFGAIRAVAPAFRVELSPIDLRDASESSAASQTSRAGRMAAYRDGERAGAVHREVIITLAARHRLPAVYPYRSSSPAVA